MTPPLPEVRVSPDGASVAIRWPGHGEWRAVASGGLWYGSPAEAEVARWPRLVPAGVPAGEDRPDDADAGAETPAGHPT